MQSYNIHFWSFLEIGHAIILCTYIICTVPIAFENCFITSTWISFLTFTLDPENNSGHHSQFSPFFRLFIAIFYLEMLVFPYLVMHTRPWQQYPSTSHQSSIFQISPFVLLFLFSIATIPYLERCAGPWKQYHYWNIGQQEWNIQWNEYWEEWTEPG